MSKLRDNLRKFLLLFLLVTLFVFAVNLPAMAETPYRTYTIDGYDQVRETQSAYIPYETIIKFDEESFNAPGDMFVSDNGKIYVADTGNSRVIVGDSEGNLEKVIGEGTLKTPRGVFVTENEHVYVADKDAAAVFEFSPEGELLNSYGKPDSPLYGDNLPFQPIKVVVNQAGIMYIISEANTNGTIQLSPANGGTFLGYFGTNLASADFMTIVYRAILTDAQRAKMVSNIPSTPDNLDIDERGIIYTATRGDGSNTVKRINLAGKNLINIGRYYDEVPSSIAVGNHQNIFVVSQRGFIYEYNFEGDLLFVFGGLDDGSQRVGLSTLASSIQVDKYDKLYVLDQDKNQIQIYEPTQFSSLLHEALDLYASGNYTASKEPLNEVLTINNMYTYANKAMGRAFFQEENYDEAMRFARLANDKRGYSDAYWEVRNNWLKENLITVLLVVIVIYVLKKIIKYLDEKKGILNPFRKFRDSLQQNRFVSNLLYGGYYIKHPIDGSYGIAKEGRSSYLISFFLLIIATIIYIVNKYFRGFITKFIPDGRYEILSDVGGIIFSFFALAIAHYLICTINEGESTVKKIFTYLGYSLIPYIIFTPISILLSYVLTQNEAFIFALIRVVIIVWTAVILFIGIKDVNNYTVKETIKVIFLTIFALAVGAVIVFILYLLFGQVFQFVGEIIGELIYKGGM